MLKFLTKAFLILISTLILFGCSSSSAPQKVVALENIKKNEEKSVESRISEIIIRKAAFKYYKYPSKRVISVYLNEVSGDNEYLLERKYINHSIEKALKKSPQINVEEQINENVDCIIELRHEKIADMNKYFITMIDYGNGKTFFNDSVFFKGNENFTISDFEDYKSKHEYEKEQESIIGGTRLKVFSNTTGFSSEEPSRYWLFTRTTHFSERSYVIEEEVPNSSIYPADIKVVIDGETYKPNSESLVFDSSLYPGNYSIVASFREGFYDGRKKFQILGKTTSKRFNIHLNKNDDMAIELLIICTQYEKSIKANVYKNKTVNVGGKISEKIELIENFR